MATGELQRPYSNFDPRLFFRHLQISKRYISVEIRRHLNQVTLRYQNICSIPAEIYYTVLNIVKAIPVTGRGDL
jgi:hypothetical protein